VWANDASALADAMNQVRTRQVKLTLEAPDPKGETALHAAVRNGWAEGVKSLIQGKAMVATQNNRRSSPMHAGMHDPRLLKILLAAKADANLQDADDDHDPRFSSTTFEIDPLIHRSPLHYVAEQCNVWSARLLLASAANPNLRDSKKETPLHLCLAALRNDELGLEEGSGVRIDGLQKKPEWNKRIGSVIGPSSGDSGRWPVVVDLEDGEMADGVLLKEDNLECLGVEMVDLLLEAKADVNLSSHVSGENRTILHEVARVGDATLVEKVLKARADVNRQDTKLGMSALHLAARSKHTDTIRLLVEARADLKQLSSAGKTAEELAKANKASPAILTMLSEADYVSETTETAVPQTLESLTAEQRAALFMD
jgi:ankyrin repeat protein